MTAREFLELYPSGVVGETQVDLSEFITEHGLDTELPPFSANDIVETTFHNFVYKPDKNR